MWSNTSVCSATSGFFLRSAPTEGPFAITSDNSDGGLDVDRQNVVPCFTERSSSQSTRAAFILDFVGFGVVWVAKAMVFVFVVVVGVSVIFGRWKGPAT